MNSISFSNTVFGQSFGSHTLAVTYYHYSGGVMSEADVLLNNHQSWDSYRGPLQGATDVRRVVVHELGHALGLDHPDDHHQHVVAIMNSVVGDIEVPQTDDIEGIQLLYGARTSSPTPTPSPTATPTPTATPITSIVGVSADPQVVEAGGSSTFTIVASSATSTARTVIYRMAGNAVYGKHYTVSGTFGAAVIPAKTTTVPPSP